MVGLSRHATPAPARRHRATLAQDARPAWAHHHRRAGRLLPALSRGCPAPSLPARPSSGSPIPTHRSHRYRLRACCGHAEAGAKPPWPSVHHGGSARCCHRLGGECLPPRPPPAPLDAIEPIVAGDDLVVCSPSLPESGELSAVPSPPGALERHTCGTQAQPKRLTSEIDWRCPRGATPVAGTLYRVDAESTRCSRSRYGRRGARPGPTPGPVRDRAT